MKVALLAVLTACSGAKNVTIALVTTTPSTRAETLDGHPLTPNGHASLTLDRGFLVVTYDVFQRSVHVSPDSPPSKKQTCSVRCDAQAVPRCATPACGDWSDIPW